MLTTQIQELKHLAHELLYLGVDDSPIYADSLCQQNKEVLQKANVLFTAQASTDEEEALLCLALLMGYNALIYTNDIETRKQTILERSWKVLEKLSPSLLKCQLLTYCYGEVFDDELAAEAHAIIDDWGKRELTAEDQEIVDTLTNLEKYPYPWSEVTE